MSLLSAFSGAGLAVFIAVGQTTCDPAASPAGDAPPSARVESPPPATVPPPPPPPEPAVSTQSAPVNPRGAAFKAFHDRMAEYVRFHNNVQKMVPALNETSDPGKISAREKALGAMLIKSRPDAQQGDFFIKEIQPHVIAIVKEDFATRPAADRKALIVELPKGVKVGINQVYPTTLPLATFPPNLLKTLPELPSEVEYRIVGRDLILRDVKGNVVIDILPAVFPIPT